MEELYSVNVLVVIYRAICNSSGYGVASQLHYRIILGNTTFPFSLEFMLQLIRRDLSILIKGRDLNQAVSLPNVNLVDVG